MSVSTGRARQSRASNNAWKDEAQILGEHYQTACEFAFELRKQKNQTVLVLLATFRAATLSTFSSAETGSLLARRIAKAFRGGETGSPRKQRKFPLWTLALPGSECLSPSAVGAPHLSVPCGTGAGDPPAAWNPSAICSFQLRAAFANCVEWFCTTAAAVFDIRLEQRGERSPRHRWSRYHE